MSSVFNTKENKAICILPWVQKYKDIQKEDSPCCWATPMQPGQTLTDLRTLMLKGIKPKSCNTCYKSENESNNSPRISETIKWINRYGEPNIDNPIVEFVDIRHDPTCNLKCKTCGPELSTLWQKEKGIKIKKNLKNLEFLESINKTKLKKVYMAGGEPTYNNDYFKFLNELHQINPNCEIVINTNLKKLSNKWKEIFKKFNNLTTIISCDAIYELGRYIRYPLEWNEFEDNVKFCTEHCNFVQFNLVASNLTTHKIYETCTWMKKYSKNINISILNKPLCMNECAVPMEYRQTYIKNIKKLKKFPTSIYYAYQFRHQIDYLIKKYTEAEYSPQLHNMLKHELTEQDSHRTAKLQNIDPFLYSWIYQ